MKVNHKNAPQWFALIVPCTLADDATLPRSCPALECRKPCVGRSVADPLAK